ncbi:alpha-1,6-mannosyl-glycoprotein 4-beta-N-acetylglucosaminyltransferase-like [Patiria miniata]|uniref:MGAT4 conserved region domain-containing protein n=1 Tax=Patiria miniata TaxID=46514 RepID=A0A914AXM5_PATMI|nr:alpha-1,6-mannosyl-glycoprotein 4-beta-N-acetylglucosaminyltransferase-like [Patiria miniata]
MRQRERRILTAFWVVFAAVVLTAVYYIFTIRDDGGGHGQVEPHPLEIETKLKEERVIKQKITFDTQKRIELEVKKSKDEPKNKTGPLPVGPPVMGCMDLEHIDKEKALVIGHRRKDRGFLTIGITNVKRKNASYLKPTLQSLIDNANEEERSKLRIVVFACDLKDEDRQEARDIVSHSFAEHVQSGLLQLIQADKSFYPPLDKLKQTFNDPMERVKWRSKENIDNVFLFAFCVQMSDYYMLLDDDLVTFPGYIQTIRNFITKHQGDHWILLDISERGTGKLFRDKDLLLLGRYLVQFYQEQPVDLLLNSMMRLQDQGKHHVVEPPLFKHLGVVSTLALKNKNGGG